MQDHSDRCAAQWTPMCYAMNLVCARFAESAMAERNQCYRRDSRGWVRRTSHSSAWSSDCAASGK